MRLWVLVAIGTTAAAVNAAGSANQGGLHADPFVAGPAEDVGQVVLERDAWCPVVAQGCEVLAVLGEVVALDVRLDVVIRGFR